MALTRARGGEAGFLYVELLVSLALLSFAVLATAPLFLLAARHNATASDTTLAHALLHAKCEELRREPLATVASGSDEVRQGRAAFARRWQVERDQPHPGLVTLEVAVTPRRGESAGRCARTRFYRAR